MMTPAGRLSHTSSGSSDLGLPCASTLLGYMMCPRAIVKAGTLVSVGLFCGSSWHSLTTVRPVMMFLRSAGRKAQESGQDEVARLSHDAEEILLRNYVPRASSTDTVLAHLTLGFGVIAWAYHRRTGLPWLIGGASTAALVPLTSFWSNHYSRWCPVTWLWCCKSNSNRCSSGCCPKDCSCCQRHKKESNFDENGSNDQQQQQPVAALTDRSVSLQSEASYQELMAGWLSGQRLRCWISLAVFMALAWQALSEVPSITPHEARGRAEHIASRGHQLAADTSSMLKNLAR